MSVYLSSNPIYFNSFSELQKKYNEACFNYCKVNEDIEINYEEFSKDELVLLKSERSSLRDYINSLFNEINFRHNEILGKE